MEPKSICGAEIFGIEQTSPNQLNGTGSLDYKIRMNPDVKPVTIFSYTKYLFLPFAIPGPLQSGKGPSRQTSVMIKMTKFILSLMQFSHFLTFQ